MIKKIQNRSDPANSEDRPIPIQSDTSAFKKKKLCNLEFLYFSVLTRSSLFGVLNTIYYSVSQLVGQKCWVSKSGLRDCSEWVADYLQPKKRHQQKNVILNAFLMRDFYFKRHARKLLSFLSDHLTPRQSKERKSAWEKGSVPTQYLRSDEMLTGLMSVALFYRYFRNLWNKKSLTSEKNELSCQRL